MERKEVGHCIPIPYFHRMLFKILDVDFRFRDIWFRRESRLQIEYQMEIE
jgi:hypothetical protein